MGVIKDFLRVALTVLLFSWIFLSFPTIVQSHGHSHDEGHSHGHSHDENPAFKYSKQANVNEDEKIPSSKIQPNPNIWVEAFTATILISVAPFLILFAIPIDNSEKNKPYLKLLLAFASGGLLGDAFLHLIPHALLAQQEKNKHSHSHSHDAGGHSHDSSIGMCVLGGIMTFLIVEKFVRLFKGGHGHSHGPVTGDANKKKGDKSKNKEVTPAQDIKVAGYLNLAADFTHNITDGLAIGASFLAGRSVGIVTTLTIFLHEIPHEIGDYAILVQSGCSKRNAMMLQMVTAVGALSGTAISLMVDGADAETIAWILPFTAGGFIYIATVSVIPELLEQSGLKDSILQIFALSTGVGLMHMISIMEEAGHSH